MKDLILSRIAFGSFIKLCFLLSLHIGAIFALVFFLTNHGRRVSFGTFYFYGFQADTIGMVFLFISIILLLTLLSTLSYLLLSIFLKITKGLKIRAVLRKD